MPRDGGGNYTLPGGNPVVSGTTIQASWANDTMTDMAESMTDSLSRSGQGGMLVPFRVSNGLATAPSLSFTSEPTLGIYRPSAGILGFAAGGGEVARIRASGNMQTAAAAPTTVADFTRKDYVDGVATGLQADIDQNASDIGDNASAIGVNAAAIGVLQATPTPKRTYIAASDPAWVPTAGVRKIRFTATGGGGGGGNCDGQDVDKAGMASSGAAGATAIIDITTIGATYALVIGAGGAGGSTAAGNGSTGGATTVIGTGVNLSCGGGEGGKGDTAVGGVSRVNGASGGIASGGDVNIRGGDSDMCFIVTGEPAGAGSAGASFWGGGPHHLINSVGKDAVVFGTGGSGGTSLNATPNNNGGAGFRGIIVIDEFF